MGLSPFLPISSVRTSSCRIGASGFIASSIEVTLGSNLVFDLDQLRRFIGQVRARRGDRSDGVSSIQHFVLGQAVGRQMRQVDCPRLAHHGKLGLQIRKIVVRDDGQHARQSSEPR